MENETTKITTTCPDCSGKLVEIKMIDSTYPGDNQRRFIFQEKKRCQVTARHEKFGYADSHIRLNCDRIFLRWSRI